LPRIRGHASGISGGFGVPAMAGRLGFGVQGSAGRRHEEVRSTKYEGQRTKDEGRRTKDKGQRTKDEEGSASRPSAFSYQPSAIRRQDRRRTGRCEKRGFGKVIRMAVAACGGVSAWHRWWLGRNGGSCDVVSFRTNRRDLERARWRGGVVSVRLWASDLAARWLAARVRHMGTVIARLIFMVWLYEVAVALELRYSFDPLSKESGG